MPAACDVQRKMTVTTMTAVEEAALLFAVQRVIGGVHVRDDLVGRHLTGFEEQLHRQPVDVPGLRDDLPVPVRGRRLRRAGLQPVQRARRGQRVTRSRSRTPPAPVTPAHPLAGAVASRGRSWPLISPQPGARTITRFATRVSR